MVGRFDGKVLFATGAGSGIAAATARRFAAEGGRVAAVDLDRERAEAVASELDDSIGLACDVADERAVQEAVRMAAERLGRIDCVMNSAGYVRFTPIEELALEEWNRLIAVHLTGTFLVCKATLPVLRAAGGGSIVNVASTSALLARPNLAAYAAAKGGIISFSRQLALDAAADNVRVNVLAPGSVRTPLIDGVYGEGAVPHAIQPRLGEPEEIAAAACFLLSDESSFFTAAMLVADGGATAL
ncbi:MAG TPA: SDR family NAD(P)-dependent oxidoreductase [Gaiellaceae bacterium]|jgi:NAD(P)-dependent dehydrogenase (short-subunit alcohol dehydrogenase family)